MGKELDDSYVLKPFNIIDPRPHIITIIKGENIRIQNITIVNLAYRAVHLVGCEDVVISGITLLNRLKLRNSDGIDIEIHNVPSLYIKNFTVQSAIPSKIPAKKIYK